MGGEERDSDRGAIWGGSETSDVERASGGGDAGGKWPGGGGSLGGGDGVSGGGAVWGGGRASGFERAWRGGEVTGGGAVLGGERGSREAAEFGESGERDRDEEGAAGNAQARRSAVAEGIRRSLGDYAASFDPGRPGLRVLLLLGVLAAIVASVYLWRSRPETEPLPQPTLAGAMPISPPPTSISQAPSPTASGVTVYVTGEVRKPGVLVLPEGSRVTDALQAAGGLKSGAKAGALNLARRLIDGEHIVVGAPAGAVPLGQAPPGLAAGGSASLGGAAGGVINLNLATAEQLDQMLPGVGEVLARRIIEYRDAHGGFRSVEQLRDVTGIGDRRFAELKDKVRV